MAKLVCLTLTILVAVAASAVAGSSETLNQAFVDDAQRDQFVTPTTISGPLDGENPADDWTTDRGGWYEPSSPMEVFAEPEDDGTTTPVTAPPPRMIYDSAITATRLAPMDGFALSDVDLRSTLIIPVFIKGSPLRLVLGAGTTMVSAPAAINVPSELYNFTAEVRCLIPLKETWAVELGAGGGLFSDLSGSVGDGFRVTGRAIFIKEASPRLKYSFGVLYLGRKNLLAMPVAGLIYTPSDDYKVELLIPRPRVMRRIAMNGTREHWMYFGAEIFGGNTWAIEHSNGSQDTFIYKDNRIIVGYEAKVPGGLSGRLEAGYVMMRHVSFSNDPATLDPGGTVMLRAGLTF